MDNRNCVMTDQYKRIQGAKLRLQNKTVSVYKGVNTIGRNKAATINLKNVNVSQHQAVIIIVDDIQHFISDLNSSNGTYLLDTKLAPFKLYELSNEIQIKFGDVTATYVKMPNLSTTVHLETETMEMTQNVTQNFYAATTQLMFDDTLNRTRFSGLQHQNTPNRDSQDIHDAATQVAVYPSTIADTEAEISNVVVETINDDIHNAATQVVDIHDAPTQVIFFPPQASTSKASQNNINKPAKSAASPGSLPQTNANLNDQEENIHEMATQVVSIHEMATQVVSFMPETIDDTQKQIEENQPKTDESTTPGSPSKPNDGVLNPIPQVDDSFITIQAHVDSSVIQDCVIEESVIEDNENIEVVNENSNDSMDFLTIQQPFEAEITQANDNGNTGVADDKNSIGSDSELMVQPKRKMSRKLSSSEDLSELQNVQKPSVSDSETDIEDSDNINFNNSKRKKLSSKSSRQAQTNKVCNSDSETDIEDDVPKETKTQPLSNSDTDIEDEKLNLSQSQDIIKPKILKRKSIFSSDSETDVEDNKKQESVLDAAQDGDSNETEILNDTDYIPATQDAFANMFQYKNSKYSNSNHNSQNVSSEESFKLGLTELMIDGEENNQGVNEEVSKDQSKDVNQGCSKPSTSNTGEIGAEDLPTENICKKDDDIYLMPTQKLRPKTVNDSSEMLSDAGLKNIDEDLYMMATQKIDEGKLIAQKLAANIINDPKSIPSTSKMVTSTEKVADEDDLYMMPTQKMEENAKSVKKINELNNFPSTSKMATNIGKESDDDFYMLATQKITDSEHEFKAPVKRFTFKKKATNLDGSLTTILGSKEEEDPYLMATQQINEPETNNEDDIYMQATQKLENNSKSNNEKNALTMQPTLDLNLGGPNASEKEENLLMAPTQQIDQDAINKMYDLETQKLDSQSTLESVKLASNDHVSKDDLYDLQTQPLSSTLDQDSPKRKRTKKSDIENLKRTIESSHTDGFVKKPLEKCGTEDDNDRAETLSQIEAFVKKPFEDARKQESSGSKIVKEDGQPNELDKMKIEAPVKTKKQLASALPTEKSSSKKDAPISKRVDEEIIRPETLSQIEAFVKEPLKLEAPRSKKISQIEPSKGNEITQKHEENYPLDKNAISIAKTRTPRTRKSTKPTEEDLYMAPTQEINQDSANEKAINVAEESSKASEEDSCVAINKEVSNNPLYMMETQKIDSQPDDIPQSDKRPSTSALGSDDTKRKTNNLELSNLEVPKRKRMKKSDIENLKKTVGSRDEKAEGIDRPETLSQIEAFIKNPADIEVPKSSKIEEITDTIVGLIKDKSDTEEPKKLTRTSRARQYTKHFDEENNKGRNKTSAKPESTRQTKLQKPIIEDSAETEIENVSPDKNMSTDTIRSDIDQSFALLEAKSTKTRKSSRITNVGEIKVAACENRRSMTTTSIPELSKIGAIESKPSTRRSRKITVNNNIVATTLQSKIDDISKQITGKSITAKRKPDASDSDFSESEVPTKMLKNNVGKGKRKASVKDDISKIYTLSEESHEDVELPARTVKASVTRKGKGKTTVNDDSDKASNASDGSGRDFELPARALKASKGKGKATSKDESDTSAASDEGNKGKEPATPSTSRARVNSRKTISKSTDIDKISNASDESGGDFELPTRVLKATKGKATGKDKSDTSATSDEGNRDKEPATPSTSRARVSSRRTISKSTGDDGSGNTLGTSVATPRRGRKNVLNDELLNTPERLKRKQRPKVVFTMLDNPQLESLIRQLGGSVVDNVDTSTVLVTEHVKRSQKLLAAVGQGKPICSPSWIRESKKANEFLDPWDFILIDKEAESKWSFSLKESISKAASEKLLTNYSFQLLVSNAVDVLKGAIEACGGKCLTRNPPKNAEGFYVVVSSPENRTKYLKIKKQHPEVIVVEPEAIFDGVLRQDLRLGRHLLT